MRSYIRLNKIPKVTLLDNKIRRLDKLNTGKINNKDKLVNNKGGTQSEISRKYYKKWKITRFSWW